MIFLKGPFIYFHKKWPTFWLPSPPHPTILKNEQQNPQTRDKFQDPPISLSCGRHKCMIPKQEICLY